MTPCGCRGVGAVDSRDIGQALQQAGTILNPGTYFNGPGGMVTYVPNPGDIGPGVPMSNSGGTSMSTMLFVGLLAYIFFKGGR